MNPLGWTFKELMATAGRHPYAAAGAVIAPMFMRNKEDGRGYAGSMLLTAPVVFAGGIAASNLFRQARKETSDVFAAISQLSASVVSSSRSAGAQALRDLRMNPTQSISTLEQNVAQYLTASKTIRSSPNLNNVLKFFDRLTSTKHLEDKLGALTGDRFFKVFEQVIAQDAHIQSHMRLYSNAIQASRRRSLTATEWMTESIDPRTATTLTREEMRTTIERYADRPEFLRSVQSQLSQAKKMNDAGADIPALFTPGGASIREQVLNFKNDKAKAYFDQVGSKVGSYLSETDSQTLRRARIKKLSIISESVTKGQTGRVLSLNISRQGGVLKVPVADLQGLVNLSPRGGNVGVARQVIDPEGNIHRLDEWITKMAIEHPEFTNEQLKQEINSVSHFFAHDPLDPYQAVRAAGQQGKSLLPLQAARLRAQSGVITSLPLFDNRTYKKLPAAEQVGYLTKLFNSDRFSAMGPESNPYEGVLQMRSLEDLSYAGVASVEKQDEIYRFLSKDFRLKQVNEDWVNRPRLSNDAFERISGSGVLPETHAYMAGISPEDQALLGDLPATWEVAQARRSGFISRLEGRGISRDRATQAFANLEKYYNQGQQGMFHSIGRLGEADFAMHPEFAGSFMVENQTMYQVDRLGIADMTGKAVSTDAFLGSRGFVNVRPEHAGLVESVTREEGKKDLFNIVISHSQAMAGAKVDVLGVKGQSFVLDDMPSTIQMLNEFYKTTGSGNRIGENVDLLTDFSHVANKTDPFAAQSAIAAEVMGRLEQQGQTSLVGKYRVAYQAHNVTYEDFQMVLGNNQLISQASKAGRQERLARVLALSQLNQEFFFQASEAIRSNRGFNDPVLRNFAASGAELEPWMLQNNMPAILRAWSHEQVFMPKHSTVTPDMLAYLNLSGNYGQMANLTGRLQLVGGGSAEQAIEFGRMLFGGKGPGPGQRVVDFAGAIGEGRGGHSLAARRSGSIFDPQRSEYRENFWLRYKNNAGQEQFLPVPGTGAYGATSPMFADGKFQTRNWQETLFQAHEAQVAGDLATQDHILASYTAVVNEEILAGKKSAFRPPSFDPMGRPGVLQTMSTGDPFTVMVDPDLLARMKTDMATLSRQPTSELFSVRLQGHESLRGSNWFGVDPAIWASYAADSDRDPLNLIPWARGSEGYAEALADVTPGSKQWRTLTVNRALQGVGEEGRQELGTGIKSLGSRIEDFVAKAGDLTGAMKRRTAGAAIGALSNNVTMVLAQIEKNKDLMRDPEALARIKNTFHNIVRQASISARKSHVEFDLEAAMKYSAQIRDTLNLPTDAIDGGAALRQTLLEMESKLMKPMGWTPEMEEVLGITGKVGEQVRPYEAYLRGEKGISDFDRIMAGRTPGLGPAIANITGSTFGGNAEQTLASNRSLFRKLEDALPPYIRGKSLGADMSAAELGALNVTTRATEVGRSLLASIRTQMKSPHAKMLGAGLAIAAVTGALMTRPRRDLVVPAFTTRTSSNRYRPDERIGVTDGIPGEGMTGSMAPTNPPRRMMPAPAQVQTAVVAPVNKMVDLEVRMKAPDRQRASETARLLSQVSTGGNSYTTINMRGNSRLQSLRTREKIREMRDEA